MSVDRGGGVKHGLARIGLALDGLGLGPAAAHFGVGDHSLQVENGFGALCAVHGQHINILIGQVAAAWAVVAIRALFGGRRLARGPVDFLQPMREFGIGLALRQLRGLGQRLQAGSFLLFGARWLGGFGGCYRIHATPQCAIQVAQPLVAGFEHQRHAVFAVVAHRAVTVAVPVGQFSVGGQRHINGQVIGCAQAALYLARHHPMVACGLDGHVQHLVAAV